MRIFQPYYFGYISTLGVIEEFRGFGIARSLVNKAIEQMMKRQRCVGVFLHVIEHNKSAMEFYKKMQFEEGPLLNDHYNINNAYFDSYVFYKSLKTPELFTGEMGIYVNLSG